MIFMVDISVVRWLNMMVYPPTWTVFVMFYVLNMTNFVETKTRVVRKSPAAQNP